MLPMNIVLARRRRLMRLREFNLERVHLRQSFNPFQLDEMEFRRRFRLTKASVRQLIIMVLPYMRNIARVNALSPELRIFAALSFFATGSYQRLIGQSRNTSMSQQSVSNCVREVSAIFTNHLANMYIQFPTRDDEKQAIKNEYYMKHHFPGIIGAIDCTHVRILAPAQEHNYINRKGYHSINVQIICDSKLKILAINPRYGGSTHDSFIWRNSAIKMEMERNYQAGDRNSWLIGDSGYPLQPWLMTPIVDAPPNTPEGQYTAAHIAARNSIERCNGVLKTRFRCINGERLLRYTPEIVGNIVTSCAVLHNMCLGDEAVVEPFRDALVNMQVPHIVQRDFIFNEGNRIRDRIIRQYFA